MTKIFNQTGNLVDIEITEFIASENHLTAQVRTRIDNDCFETRSMSNSSDLVTSKENKHQYK